MLYSHFHVENEIPIKCLFTQWEWPYKLEFGPKDEVHSIIWVIWTSGLQECKGNFNFWRWAERATIFNHELQYFRFVLWGSPGCARSQAPAPIHLPLKVRRGRVNVHCLGSRPLLAQVGDFDYKLGCSYKICLPTCFWYLAIQYEWLQIPASKLLVPEPFVLICRAHGTFERP